MQNFSLVCFAFTLVPLFLAKFSNGQPMEVVNDNGTEIEGDGKTRLLYRVSQKSLATGKRVPDLSLCQHSVDKIGCKPSLHRCDYVVTPGLGAHKVHKRLVTWNEARKICLMEGAHLAILDSARKEALFKSWMSEGSLPGFWLGFHDIFEEGSWTTVTGELVDTLGYHPWANDEPNNVDGGQNCAVLWEQSKKSGADDFDCSQKCQFVCEINLCNSLHRSTAPNDPVALDPR